MPPMRRNRTFAEAVAAQGADPIADLQGGERIADDVPTADTCTAANAGSRIETRVTSRLPRRSVRAALPYTAWTLGREWINLCRGNAMNSKGGRTGFALAQRRSSTGHRSA